MEYDRKAQSFLSDLEAMRDRLEVAEQAELELRQRHDEVEARAHTLELEIQRRIDELRPDLAGQIREQVREDARLEIQVRDAETQRLQHRISQLKESSADRSQEAQGEALEQILLSVLQESFPSDLFQEIPRGQTGADIIQVVRDANLTLCGRIACESKNARNWSDTWVSRAKEAQRKADCDACVIVTRALPRNVEHIAQQEGVWITQICTAAGLGLALRQMILRVCSFRAMYEGRKSRYAALHRYLVSNEFRLQCEATVAFVQMLEKQLESEKRTMHRSWQRRQLCISGLGLRVAEIVGGLEGTLSHDLLIGEGFEQDPQLMLDCVSGADGESGLKKAAS